MVNESIILRLMGNIDGYLKDLETLSSLSEFQNDIKTQRFTERTLQIIIEAMLDITHHIISDENFREPDSYSDAFKILAENKIIRDDFLPTIKQMAQFRNKLVHYYEKIDPDIVFIIATQKQSDIKQFVSQIKSWLTANKI